MCGKGPVMGVIWFYLVLAVFAVVALVSAPDVIYLTLGFRSLIAFAGYLIMQVGLWHTEKKWDEDGSAAWLKVAGADSDGSVAPEVLEERFNREFSYNTLMVTISPDELKAAFPIPWGFLVGWWVWGISYLFPIDGSADMKPTVYGIFALLVCFFVSFVASIPMSDAVMNRLATKKKRLSLMFLLGWITLGVMSAMDISTQKVQPQYTKGADYTKIDSDTGIVWFLCMLGPITIIMSQKILFGARKMGDLWEQSGKPNFHPIVYNMGGPLFVWGWFLLWVATSGIPAEFNTQDIYPARQVPYIPLFLNMRTLMSFVAGCSMIPVVRFLDYAHDEDGKWLGENKDGAVFGTWWFGTDGTYFGVFLESPWPFVIAWSLFGLSSFFTLAGGIHAGAREIIIFVNCILQGVDAGILIQQNLYAGNMAGKQKFSVPFLLLFVALAVNVGYSCSWKALALSLPGAVLIVLGQKTVFGDRKRGDYTMQNSGQANPYHLVNVYSWGEVFFMMGWILLCLGISCPTQ